MKHFVPGFSWALLVFILSSISTGRLSLPDFWDLFSIDKLGHAVFYFILYILWAKGFISSKKTNAGIYIMLLFLCIGYGALLELYQGYFLTNRFGSWVDGLANTIGVFAGYIYINWKKNRIASS